jgi:hypothetical protein
MRRGSNTVDAPRSSRRRPGATPVRKILDEKCRLQNLVRDGLDALSTVDKKRFDEQLRARFADSLELDAAMDADVRYKDANRWDYLIGDTLTQLVIAVEPHSAKSDEVSKVIAKRAAAREQLQPHLRNGARIAAWLWVASGDVQFADTDKERRRLDQAGITFVGKRVLAKHLPQR